MLRIWWSLNRDFRMWNLLSCHYENFPLLSNTNFRGDYQRTFYFYYMPQTQLLIDLDRATGLK